ncbi:MAG: hypothetical protein QM783_13280 [Phycisphaerales bacterium]
MTTHANDTSSPTDNLDRRFLLGGLAGAAGIAALAAMTRPASAGPLNPPAGPIAGTSHTLDEIYNKIPASGTGAGRIPLVGGNQPITITQSGSYILTGNLANTGSNPLAVFGANIDIDLNGYSVSGELELSAIVVQGRNIRIRNGIIRESYYGVGLTGISGVVLEDLIIDRCRFAGIAANGGTMQSINIRRCNVFDTGAISLPTDPPSGSYRGIYLNGSGHTVTDCTVQRIIPPVGAAFRGIELTGSGHVVARCMVSSNAALAGIGILCSGGTYRDNTVVNFTTPYSGARQRRRQRLTAMSPSGDNARNAADPRL